MPGYNFSIGRFTFIHVQGFGITVFFTHAYQSFRSVLVNIVHPVVVVLINVFQGSNDYFPFPIAIDIRLRDMISTDKAIERDFVERFSPCLKDINGSYSSRHQPVTHVWELYFNIFQAVAINITHRKGGIFQGEFMKLSRLE